MLIFDICDIVDGDVIGSVKNVMCAFTEYAVINLEDPEDETSS